MPAITVHRIEVRTQPGRGDPNGAAALREAQSLDSARAPRRIDSASVYLIQGTLARSDVQAIAHELLADPVTEEATIGASPPRAEALIEVHPLPGVMDPQAESIEGAIRALTGTSVQVMTGRRYDLHGIDQGAARELAAACFANGLVHAIHDRAYHPGAFPSARPHDAAVKRVPLVNLDDAALQRLSREAHLFLSVEEMRAIQAHFRARGRGEEPREIELETIAQTWSEHCVHKTIRSTIRYSEPAGSAGYMKLGTAGRGGAPRPGHAANPDGSITISNLLRSTIAAATHELMADGIDWCLSVFVDNSGVIAFDEEWAVCFKCETHNHPSALEPYGGAATGIGGCIRDIIGTGLAAKPIAATDVFCVAFPDRWAPAAKDAGARSPSPATGAAGIPRAAGTAQPLPRGVLHPRRILTQVVAGVRDYGNRMGIPTLNGAVWFDDDYVANPLVFCGCIGLLPRDKVTGEARPGDRIIAMGGRTGRDGIHGATFSSAELTETHADEFSHAVQIGNAITEKKVLDAILAARDDAGGCLFHAITDCGAGGFSSAVGEMGRVLGAEVHLDRAPLKYAGLSPTEIWISEAQERMVLAVPPANLERLRAIGRVHDVEMCDLGAFGTPERDLRLLFRGAEMGRLSMAFLHEGMPQPAREAAWRPPRRRAARPAPGRDRFAGRSIAGDLAALLAHPNIASKRWIVRQYDHEVQGRTVIKPCAGGDPQRDGPSDGAVITPVPGRARGLAIANGLATGLRDDPYVMALAAIDECVRNLVCVGADPSRIALLDNFSWPGVGDAESLGGLVRAATGCYDGAKAYRTPFISGKDSLNNQFTTESGRTIRIPPTLLISGFGIVPDVRECVTMDLKSPGNLMVLVGGTAGAMGGSHYERLFAEDGELDELPSVDLDRGPLAARLVHALIRRGLVRSAHDVSDGGVLVAAAEMAMAGDLGLALDLSSAAAEQGIGLAERAFSEEPSRYLLEIQPGQLSAVRELVYGVPLAVIGEVNTGDRLALRGGDELAVDELRAAWTSTLDW